MDQQVAPIPVFRPPFLTDGGEFRGSLVESPANVFYQQVKASRATLNRMQFQWRSVSDSLLLSPLVRLRFHLDITCPQTWTQLLSYASCQGILQHKRDQPNPYTDGTAAPDRAAVPLIVFADADAFSSCCSSMNLVFNGTSISLNRTQRFWRDYMRCMIASEDAARIYKAGGGAYDAYDQRPVVCSAKIPAQGGVDGHAIAYVQSVGITQDSGINERSKALYALTISKSETDGNDFKRRVQISVPVPIPPFNPWRGYAMPASCPYTKTPLSIPHLSAGGLDFLLEDFETSFIRRLGNVNEGGNNASATGTDAKTTPLKVALVEDSVSIELKYYRLSFSRSLKESYRFQIWQAQTFLGKAPPNNAANGWVDRGDGVIGLQITGKDDNTTDVTSKSMFDRSPPNGVYDIEFDTINLAQVPSYLLISVPKLNSSYSHAARDDGANAVFNLSRNLSIKSIRIIVNSARGAIEKSADVDTGFIDAERLWEMTKENSNSRYFEKGGFRAWRDHNCAILLSSSQFATGLMACDGVAYPVQIQIELRVENRSVDLSAQASFLRGQATDVTGGRKDHSICRLVPDIIRAQAQCTAFYQKVVLATTETAGTVNSMNYPLSSAERLLNAQGRIR